MNEINFRTKLLTHPQVLDDEMLAFLEAQPEKRKVVQEVREFDQKLTEVLDVDIPEGLHARILLNQSYQENRQQAVPQNSAQPINKPEDVSNQSTDKSASWWSVAWLTKSGLARPKLAMAASIVGFVLVWGLWQNYPNATSVSPHGLVNHIIAHIEEDPSLMSASNLPKDEQAMQALFATVGAQISKPVEGMSYAGVCDVEGQKGLHIVMQDKGQPITIIVMPGQQVAAIKAFKDSGYQGEIVPVNGGVVAIVANTMEQVALAQSRFFKAVKFA